MSYTIPPDTRKPLDLFHDIDHNNITDVLTGMGAVLNVKNTAYAGGAKGDGTTNDTAAIAAAITALGAALASGPASLVFPDGTYVIDAGAFVVQSLANFTIRGSGAAVIKLAANRVGQYNTNGNLATIADCTDFTVRDLRFDWNRDTVAPMTPLTASASSGQPSVTVAAGNGARYLAGQRLQLYGGMGTSDQAKADTGPASAGMTIQSITAGGGAGGGDLITFATNLGNTYTQLSNTALSDGFGPYAYAGAYLSPYQTGSGFTAAGRTLGNEDTQNALHLLSCQRFLITGCDARNTWESPVKLGTGFASTATTDGCSQGIVAECKVQHGYDQGIAVWNCSGISVTGNRCQAAGWAGISLTHCADSTVTGNICTNNIYSPGSDNNEGTGIAVEGGVRCSVSANACSNNNSNGIRLTLSPMFGGLALSQGVSGSLAAGATSITMTSPNSNMVNGASFTIVDPSNPLIRETIYCSGSSGTTMNLSLALRNSYASGPTIFARYGQDVMITGNTCSRQALSAGILANQQIGLRVVANTCSENGLLSGVFTDTPGAVGIHLGGTGGHCEEAVLQANTCSFNAQEGITVDNTCQGTQVLGNTCDSNGISGSTQKHGIKLFGLVDGVVAGNICNHNTHSGIYAQDGTITTAHLLLADNTCEYNVVSGIFLDNGGATCTVRGNKAGYSNSSFTGHGIQVNGYSSSVFTGNQCYNTLHGGHGIHFDAGTSSRHCTKNVVAENILFDDQGSPTQGWGFHDTADASSGTNTVAYNRTFGNTNAGQLSTQVSDTLTGNIIS